MPDDMPALLPAQRHDAGRPSETPPSERAAVTQLRGFIVARAFKPGDKLPPERQLSVDLGMKRSDLRKALDHLEGENCLWRHVGKGTFLAAESGGDPQGAVDRLAQTVGPADVMRARSALEPAIAREAALHASAASIAKLSLNLTRARQAPTWREYEALDADFHRQIAEAGGSLTLLALFDHLNALRRMITWGRVVRTTPRPPEDHESFADHARILAGIAARDPDAAHNAMRLHLRAVERRLFS